MRMGNSVLRENRETKGAGHLLVSTYAEDAGGGGGGEK
jgi:hypothetical protein